QLLRALLIQSLYTVRSERLLMEEIDYSVLYRWFVGLGMDDTISSPRTFSKYRDGWLESDATAAVSDELLDADGHAAAEAAEADWRRVSRRSVAMGWGRMSAPLAPPSPRNARRRSDCSTPAHRLAAPSVATRILMSAPSWPRCERLRLPRMWRRKPGAPPSTA